MNESFFTVLVLAWGSYRKFYGLFRQNLNRTCTRRNWLYMTESVSFYNTIELHLYFDIRFARLPVPVQVPSII